MLSDLSISHLRNNPHFIKFVEKQEFIHLATRENIKYDKKFTGFNNQQILTLQSIYLDELNEQIRDYPNETN